VLELDDAALARLVRGARQISWRKRSRWLQEIAAKIDPPAIAPSRTAAAKRQARVRARRKNGIDWYRLEISHRGIEGMIAQWIATEQITEEQALRLDRHAIERLLMHGIEQQGARWAR
jgi:hypothetical protein